MQPSIPDAAFGVARLLEASAQGKFRTTGRYRLATVRGTIWTIADRCDGTVVHAIRDTVLVRHKTILLHARHTYPARAIASHKALDHAGASHKTDAAVQLV